MTHILESFQVGCEASPLSCPQLNLDQLVAGQAEPTKQLKGLI